MTAAWLRVTALTHRGAIRTGNEDSLVVGGFTACGVDLADPVTLMLPMRDPVVVAVADGMGGHEAGEMASAHAVRSLAATSPKDAAQVEVVLRRIDDDLTSACRDSPGLCGLGTTIAGVLIGSQEGHCFTVGDSRVYAEHGGYLAQLSVDDRGPTGGLTQSLGGRSDGSALWPRLAELPAGSRLLLCSDGLSDLVNADTIEKLLATSDEPARTVRALWVAAMNASGRDNITIVLVEPDND
ncbi:MAG TPA: PP2C family serine/threonine-protein phosphatase [Pseudonocardiaceae bacterium]|nr:PP2C family serine/threonine-protein phosphatase [Pseudonocardiaceae bacterium]